MQAEINFQIGNQELVNFMVEQQIQQMRDELASLEAELLQLREKYGESSVSLKQLATAAAELHIRDTVLPLMEQMGVGKRTISVISKRIEITCCLDLYNGKLRAGASVRVDSDKEDVCAAVDAINNLLEITLPNVLPAKEARDHQKMRDTMDEISLACRGLRKKMENRDDIQRTALAQMTRKALSDNPQLMDQLRGIAASITGNTKLLESK